MADLNSSESLKQTIRAVRSLVDRLNAPLVSFDLPIDGLNLDVLDAMPSFVEFDPFVQFAPPTSAESSTAGQTRSFQKSPANQFSKMRSSSQVPNLLSENLSNGPAPSPLPVFPLRSLSPGNTERDPERSQPISRPASSHFAQGQQASLSRQADLPKDQALLSGFAKGDRPIPVSQPPIVNPSRFPATDSQIVSSPTNPTPTEASAPTANEIRTLTVIEQVVSQLIADSSVSDANLNSNAISKANSSSSLQSFSASQIPGDSLPSSPMNPSPSRLDTFSSGFAAIHSSPFSFHSSNENSGLKQSILHPDHSVTANSLDDRFYGADVSSPDAEPALAEMAETLTLLVNDVLVEQARRHGVDLS